MNVGADLNLDPTLHAFVRGPEPDRPLEAVLASVDAVVGDTIRRTLRAHFRAGAVSAFDDISDLRNDVIVRLVRRLQELRADPSADPIQNFAAYATTVATNVCYAHFRRRYPEWTRLRNQVRYIVTHDPGIEVQRSAADDSISVKTSQAVRSVPRGRAMQDLVRRILDEAGGAMPLNDLVKAVAQAQGIQGDMLVPLTADVERVIERSEGPTALDTAGDHQIIARLWEEVRQLPIRQRLALLLNLRDDRGRGVIVLLPLTAIATMQQIAATLELSIEELKTLWKELPLDDRRIAERLSLTRQQVINLRKAARARLARRMAAW